MLYNNEIMAFIEDFSDQVAEKTFEKISKSFNSIGKETKTIKGIRGLAAFLNISVTKAQEIKDLNPRLAHPIGKLIYFFEDEIVDALRNCKIKA